MSAREYAGPLFAGHDPLAWMDPYLPKPHPEEAARDAALASVAANNAAWMSKGLSLLGTMRRTYAQASGEEIREWMLRNGLGEPTSPKAWGSLINHASRLGALKDSGKSTRMRAKGSHGRRTPLWLLA